MTPQAGGVLEPLQAKLQTDVGTFLGLKQRLLGTRFLPVSPAQQQALAAVYADQLQLEAQLPTVLDAVGRLQSWQINFTDSFTVGTFVPALELHISRAQAVLAGLPAPPATTVNWGTVLLWGGGAAVAWWALRSGSSALLWIGLAAGGYLVYRNWTPSAAPARP